MIIKPDALIESFHRISPAQKKALVKMRIRTAEDLLRHLPTRYGGLSPIKPVEYLNDGENATVYGKISHLEIKKTFRSRVPVSKAIIEDSTGKASLIWFSQPYIAKMFSEGEMVRIEGKVSTRDGKPYFSNPKIDKAKEAPIGASGSLFAGSENASLTPVYSESRGISSLWIYHVIQKIIKSGTLDLLQDTLPQEILKKYSLPSLKSAMIWIHAPRKKEDAQVAQKRFSFEEIFLIQLDRQKERMLAQMSKSFVIPYNKNILMGFLKSFSFPLTSAQERAAESIVRDMSTGMPMSRLLEGDVGSGKTAVAVLASLAAINAKPPKERSRSVYERLQVAYMAPTEILSEQHFNSFIEHFSGQNIKIGLLTGSGAKKYPAKSTGANKNLETTRISRQQLLKWVENGEINILIGTHALIQKKVRFKNLGLIIIDEQHRFGVKQRMELRRKHDLVPHLLSMTATPIPRTLALTIFGDLDLSILDEMPPGRTPVETKIVLSQDRQKAYEEVRNELREHRQAYVICPRIDEPDPAKELTVNAKSVIEEAKRLKAKVFPEFIIETLTGRDSGKEKEAKMKRFKDGKIDILVATSVVEVGVSVANSTVIIIENAERFGLAQLHQLRGRVLRSTHKAYCFVFAQTQSDKSIRRLRSFVEAKNGFELAEADLQQRGAGDLSGVKQWGLSDLAMEALKNIKMVEAVRFEARKLLEKDFELKGFPLLRQKLAGKLAIHME
jgi:ATP-dependent DNA helicase RecG